MYVYVHIRQYGPPYRLTKLIEDRALGKPSQACAFLTIQLADGLGSRGKDTKQVLHKLKGLHK